MENRARSVPCAPVYARCARFASCCRRTRRRFATGHLEHSARQRHCHHRLHRRAPRTRRQQLDRDHHSHRRRPLCDQQPQTQNSIPDPRQSRQQHHPQQRDHRSVVSDHHRPHRYRTRRFDRFVQQRWRTQLERRHQLGDASPRGHLGEASPSTAPPDTSPNCTSPARIWSGTLPDELGDLTELTRLDLRSNPPDRRHPQNDRQPHQTQIRIPARQSAHRADTRRDQQSHQPADPVFARQSDHRAHPHRAQRPHLGGDAGPVGQSADRAAASGVGRPPETRPLCACRTIASPAPCRRDSPNSPACSPWT